VNACPDCGGRRHLHHPAGPLVYDHTASCRAGAAEDGQRVADHGDWRSQWTRPATATERRLLASLGIPVPDDLETEVTRSAIVRRDWTITQPATGPGQPTSLKASELIA
jgi:hypothetical protein